MNNTGRIVINDKAPRTPFELFQNNIEEKKDFNDSMKTIQYDTHLSKYFFSRNNIDLIHHDIIITVQKNSGYKIGKQDETQLQIIMRSIFLQYAKHLPCKINEQIRELNKKVVMYSVNAIITEIKQYLGYRDNVSNAPVPIDLPKNLSIKGTKVLNPNIGFN